MGRKILALIVAMITAVGTIVIVGMIASRMWSTPNNLEYMSMAEMSAYMASRSADFYIVLLIGNILGAFFGGFIVTKMSRRESPGILLPVVIGAFLTIGAALNFISFSGQPVWFMALSLISFIPMALLAHRLAR